MGCRIPGHGRRRRRPLKTIVEPERLGCPDCASAEIGPAPPEENALVGDLPRPALVGVYECRECRSRFRL